MLLHSSTWLRVEPTTYELQVRTPTCCPTKHPTLGWQAWIRCSINWAAVQFLRMCVLCLYLPACTTISSTAFNTDYSHWNGLSAAATMQISKPGWLNENKVLYCCLLPPVLPQSYNLRKWPHSRQIPNGCSYLTDCNFLTRMLFADSYWWCFSFSFMFVLCMYNFNF